MTNLPRFSGERLVVATEVLGEDPIQIDLVASLPDPTIHTLPAKDVPSVGFVAQGFSITDAGGELILRGQDAEGEHIEQTLLPARPIELSAWLQPTRYEDLEQLGDVPPRVQFTLGKGAEFAKEVTEQTGGYELEAARITYPAEEPVLRASFYAGWVTMTAIYYTEP